MLQGNPGKSLATLLLFLLFTVQYSFAQSAQKAAGNKSADSINALLKADKQDTIKVRHLNELSQVLQMTGDLSAALEAANNALTLAQRLNDKKQVAIAENTLGSAYYYSGSYPDAMEWHIKALKIYESIKDNVGIASASCNIGNVYKEQGNYAQALDWYTKALDLDTKLNRKKGIASIYGNIGIVHWNMGDTAKALDFYKKALALDEEINDKNATAADLTNIGNVYSQQNDTARAMENYNKALNMYARLGNMGNLAIVSGNIGEVYLKEKKNSQAEKFLSTSLTLAEKADNLEEMKRDYQVLSALYAEEKDWKKAYENNLHYTAIKGTLLNIENTKKIVREQMQYDFEKKQAAQKAEQDQLNLIREEERKKQRILTILIGAIALILTLIVLFVFRVLKATQREKLIVEQQKSLMELKALRAQMNPHFIFNAINSIQHFILKNDADAAQKHLTKFSKLIRKVLENSRHESIPLQEEIQMLELYTELEQVRFSSKFHYAFEVDPAINAEKIMISPLILQPFIENAIWHGLMHLKGKQGELQVRFSKEDSVLKCVVDDNGIGRKRSQEMRSLAQHQPMGLSITNERVQVLNEVYKTNIRINVIDKVDDKGEAAGTRVELTIPI